MTDTARSLAAIKALLADNTSSEISPQDLRDAIESIVNPIEDGGVTPARPMFKRVFIQFMANIPNIATIPASVANQTSAAITLSVDPTVTASQYNDMVDPNGWWSPTYSLADDDPSNTWAIERPAGSCVMLPPGIYVGTAFIQLVTAIDVATQFAIGQWDQVEFNSDFDYPSVYYPNTGSEDGPYLYDAYFGPFPNILQGTQLANFQSTSDRWDGRAWTTSMFLLNDTDEPKPFAVSAYQKNNTSSAPVLAQSFQILQVGGPGW